MKKLISSIYSVSQLLLFLLMALASPTMAQERTITAPISTGPINMQGVINTIVQLVFGVGIFVCVVFLVVYGIKYIMAGDDTKKIAGARKSITGALIGVAIIMSTFTIIKFVAVALGANPNSLFDILPTSLGLSTRSY